MLDLAMWDPWHGCTKISPSCSHCYVYWRDAKLGKDATRKGVSAVAGFGLLARFEKKSFQPKSEFNRVEMCVG